MRRFKIKVFSAGIVTRQSILFEISAVANWFSTVILPTPFPVSAGEVIGLYTPDGCAASWGRIVNFHNSDFSSGDLYYVAQSSDRSVRLVFYGSA